MLRVAVVTAVLLLAGMPARAVILSDTLGTGNTSAPPDDPGWDYFGVRMNLSAVYMGNGWVLTAAHVGTGPVEIQGITYLQVTGSEVFFFNPDQTQADLKAFRIVGQPNYPDLGVLEIAPTAPAVGTEVILIGHGHNRGDPITWMGIDGWDWGPGFSTRWGTNRIDNDGQLLFLSPYTTQTVTMDFTESGPSRTSDECQVATGDSGGALFAPDGFGGWELAGTLVARGIFTGQDVTSALYGNITYAADLATYRDDIIATVRAACSNEIDDDGDGFWDYPDDPECESLEDDSEISLAECNDGIDNDGDGLRDYPADPGCRDADWPLEAPECDDGIDNDGDGGTDHDGAGTGTADPQCVAKSWGVREAPSGCGLGFEVAFVLPLLAALGRRRRRGR